MEMFQCILKAVYKPGVLTSVTVCCTPGRCICTWENNGPSTTRTAEKSHGMISASLSGRNKYAPLRSRPGRAWYLENTINTKWKGIWLFTLQWPFSWQLVIMVSQVFIFVNMTSTSQHAPLFCSVINLHQ